MLLPPITRRYNIYATLSTSFNFKVGYNNEP